MRPWENNNTKTSTHFSPPYSAVYPHWTEQRTVTLNCDWTGRVRYPLPAQCAWPTFSRCIYTQTAPLTFQIRITEGRRFSNTFGMKIRIMKKMADSYYYLVWCMRKIRKTSHCESPHPNKKITKNKVFMEFIFLGASSVKLV